MSWGRFLQSRYVLRSYTQNSNVEYKRTSEKPAPVILAKTKTGAYVTEWVGPSVFKVRYFVHSQGGHRAQFNLNPVLRQLSRRTETKADINSTFLSRKKSLQSTPQYYLSHWQRYRTYGHLKNMSHFVMRTAMQQNSHAIGTVVL